MKTIHSVLLIIFFISTLNAQNINDNKVLTGNLSADAKQILNNYIESD